jgi:hypothetical protein
MRNWMNCEQSQEQHTTRRTSLHLKHISELSFAAVVLHVILLDGRWHASGA